MDRLFRCKQGAVDVINIVSIHADGTGMSAGVYITLYGQNKLNLLGFRNRKDADALMNEILDYREAYNASLETES